MSSSSQYIFKIKYGSTLRRIRVDRYSWLACEPTTLMMKFSELEETVRRIFKLPETFEFVMVYTDMDNDEVTIASDADIEDALLYQKLNPLRVTVLAQESQRSALDNYPSLVGAPPAPPSWAADIILKLDQVLLALNKKPVDPRVDSVITTKSTRTEQHALEGVDDLPSDGFTIKPAENVVPAAIAQSGYDSEFLRRAMILRQRVTTEELNV